MTSGMNFQAGQRFLIRCDSHEVRVKSVFGGEVAVLWPWGQVDPGSRTRWDGSVAVPSDPLRFAWFESPWRLEPSDGLRPGDICQLFIPPTEVIVRHVESPETPLDIGRVPRPTQVVEFAMIDETQHLEEEELDEASFTIFFELVEPIEFIPLD